MYELIQRSRAVKPYVLWLAAAAIVFTTILINQWFFPSGAWKLLGNLSSGWFNATLQAGWISILVIAGLVIVLVGRLRPRQFGVDFSKLGAGLLYTAIVWLVLNGIFFAAAGASFQLHATWVEMGARYKLSEFVGQIAGNALAEEIVYRGFFLTQGLFLLRPRFERKLWLWAALAILFSAAIFAVSHVPNRLWKGRYDSALAIVVDQAQLMFGGVIFGWMYLRTQNLFFVVGVHALVNRPTLLPALPEKFFPPALAVYALGLIAALIWNKLPKVETPAMKTKMQSSVLLVIAFVLLSPWRSAAADLRLGVDTIVPRQVYVVYSGLNENGKLTNTSNIYVIRGAGAAVWIFGAGYGDQNGDVQIYRGLGIDCARNAIADAREVDSLITAAFELQRTEVQINFIAPHFHLDHINQEFFTALFDSLKYSLTDANIFVHVNDSTGAGCNARCCGVAPCNQRNEYFGAPYQPAWNVKTVARMQFVGTPRDTCNQSVMFFDSPTGAWLVKKDLNLSEGGHTSGTVHLDNLHLGYRLSGTDTRGCALPAGLTRLPSHGNLEIAVGVAETPVPVRQFELAQNYPNPFNPSTVVSFQLPVNSHVTLKVFDVNGREVATLVDDEMAAGNHAVRFAPQDLAGGIYFYQLTAGKFTQTRKAILVK